MQNVGKNQRGTGEGWGEGRFIEISLFGGVEIRVCRSYSSDRVLYDRDYMRGAAGGRWRSPVTLLLIALTAVFLVECFLRVYQPAHSLLLTFGLNYPTFRHHEYWRLLTYQFLHDAPWPLHLLFNGLALWFFGRPVLEALGSARFWQIFLLSGVVGGLFEVACEAWHPVFRRMLLETGQSPLVVGSSASILGLIGTFCFLDPSREIVFFFYIIPVRLRSLTLFWIVLGFSIFGILFPMGDVAHAAHLGGLLTGVVFVRLLHLEDARAWLRRFAPKRTPSRQDVPVTAVRAAGRPSRAAIPGAELETPDEFMRREVDPILDKISAHGIQSLTDRERRILEKARERMRGR